MTRWRTFRLRLPCACSAQLARAPSVLPRVNLARHGGSQTLAARLLYGPHPVVTGPDRGAPQPDLLRSANDNLECPLCAALDSTGGFLDYNLLQRSRHAVQVRSGEDEQQVIAEDEGQLAARLGLGLAQHLLLEYPAVPHESRGLRQIDARLVAHVERLAEQSQSISTLVLANPLISASQDALGNRIRLFQRLPVCVVCFGILEDLADQERVSGHALHWRQEVGGQV